MSGTGHTIKRRIIPEIIQEGKRLGRHCEHDSRTFNIEDYMPARLFRGKRTTKPVPPTVAVKHQVHLGRPLDQGQIGSCTGQAMCGDLMTGGLWKLGRAFGESTAMSLYEKATTLDTMKGSYPPDDTGSTGLAVMKAAQADGWISAYAAAMSTNAALAALSLTGVIVGTNWYDCLPDDQRVLTSDLRWVPIQKLDVGDELIGFDEQAGATARFRPSIVQALGKVVRPTYEIVTDQGTVCASGGHLFVATTRSRGHAWTRTDALKPGDRMVYIMRPYEQDRSWEAGWLAGFFDGEGTCSRYQLNIGQVVGPTLDKLKKIMDAKGYGYTVKQIRPIGVDGRGIHSRKLFENMYVHGPYHDAMRFLGEVRPERLVNRGRTLWEDHGIRSRTCPAAVVQSVRFLGNEEVNSIATSTRTLVTEGFLSHNCFDSPDASGLVAIGANAQVRGGHEYLLFGVDPGPRLVYALNSWGADWGVKGVFSMSWDTLDELLYEDGDCYVGLTAS